jgi:hypothetical protein
MRKAEKAAAKPPGGPGEPMFQTNAAAATFPTAALNMKNCDAYPFRHVIGFCRAGA